MISDRKWWIQIPGCFLLSLQLCQDANAVADGLRKHMSDTVSQNKNMTVVDKPGPGTAIQDIHSFSLKSIGG